MNFRHVAFLLCSVVFLFVVGVGCSSDDDPWSVTVVDAAEALVSNTKTDLPAGAAGPGHAIWLDESGNQILISCNSTDNVVVAGSGL